MNYTDALRYLYSLADFERTGRFSRRGDLAAVRAFLEELGKPHLGRITVHVAGSKGKGSVAAMCAAILRSAGQTVGLYTSPHLHRFTERIQIDGVPVTPEEFAAGVAEVMRVIERTQARFPDRQVVTFDALTALGFLLFRQRDVNVQIIEVGLGGTLDSTNVFDTKECSVITNIGLEHQAILGDTVAEIAAQKAGIIVANCPTVMAPQRESAAEVIRRVAKDRGSELIEVASVCGLRRDSASLDQQVFKLQTAHGSYRLKLPLAGKHQLDNAATAVVAVETLRSAGIEVTEAAMAAGLESLHWPGRVEILKRRPLIVVDVAHTADSARRLRETLEEYLLVGQATLVVGLMSDKDGEALASAIEPVARRVIVTRADHPRAAEAESVARHFRELGVETMVQLKVASAVDTALALSTPSDAVVILGSVALVGEARSHILGIERDPSIA